MQTILTFLEELARNNNREWFIAHKDAYETARAHFDTFSKQMIEKLTGFDARLVGLTLKECTFRIYQDLRFHKDRPPYKYHFGIYACPRGKNSGYAGYYVHLEPINDYFLLCSGLYNPEPLIAKRIREEFAHNGKALTGALEECPDFTLPWATAYKKTPSGYSASDTYADYFRLRSYELYKEIPREEVLRPDFLDRLKTDFQRTYRFNELLNRCVDEVRNG